jgi:hypothetical protein
MLASEAASFEYQERIVAFIDVLGFSDLVKASDTNPVARGKISKLIVSNRLFERVMDDARFAGATFFSDSFVLSMQPDRMFYMVREVGHLCRFLLLQGLPCRGAITVGSLYHHDRLVIGPAFLDAYRLEQSVACYPRIILDDTAIEFWRMEFASPPAHVHLESLVKLDRDGQHFIDIFSREWDANFISWTDIVPSPESPPNDHADFMELASQQIQDGLAANTRSSKVRAKYEWLATECNAQST